MSLGRLIAVQFDGVTRWGPEGVLIRRRARMHCLKSSALLRDSGPPTSEGDESRKLDAPQQTQLAALRAGGG